MGKNHDTGVVQNSHDTRAMKAIENLSVVLLYGMEFFPS